MEPATGESVAAPPLADEREPARQPETPSLSAREWVRRNLFSTPFNSVLTVVFGALALLVARGLLNFTFSEEREWDAVRTNLRLIFTHAYPEEQYIRIWVCVGTVAVLGGLSVGLLEIRGRGVSMKKISTSLMGTGGLFALGILMTQPTVLKDAEGTVLRDDDGVLRQSFAEAMADRWVWWLVAVGLAGLGAALWHGLGDARRRNTFVPSIELFIVLVGLLVLSAWVYPWGHYAYADGQFIAEPDRTVADSTKIPWTVVWLLGVAALTVGRRLRDRGVVPRVRLTLNLAWVLCPFVLYWVVLRDPALDAGRVVSVDVPLAVLFAVLGGGVLWVLTRPGIGELGRIIALALLGVAMFNWVAAFFGWYSMLQKVRISFLLLAVVALAAHNFAGERAKRLRLLVAWIAGTAVFHYMATLMNAPSTVETPTGALIGGFALTMVVSVFTLMFSFPLGVLLALARTSKFPIFRVLSTSFIEVIRGVPLITILIFGAIILPLFLPDGMAVSHLAAATTGFALFSAAYLAENVRAGSSRCAGASTRPPTRWASPRCSAPAS